jgi:MEDS: MEthanogen/methylotroph, DcmR Sensory domain
MHGVRRERGQLADLGHVGRGSHVCYVADSAARLAEWTAACMAGGAELGEKLVKFVPQIDTARRDEVMIGAVRATMVDPRVAFLGSGGLEEGAMLAAFREMAAAARREGYRGLRVFADMDWLLPAPPGRERLTAFEQLLDRVVTELEATVVCAYRTDSFAPETLAEVAAVHPATAGTVPVEPGFRCWNVADGVWELAGEVDYLTVELFTRVLRTAAEGASVLCLTVTDLSFIDVAGMRAIAQLAADRPELELVIDGAGELLSECWALLDLGRRLDRVRLRPSPGVPAARAGGE